NHAPADREARAAPKLSARANRAARPPLPPGGWGRGGRGGRREVPNTLPLDGLRVLELGHIIAGPSAGLLLAGLGAAVLQRERPGEGDQSRTMPAGTSANFHFLNRNKRSIAIDLKGSAEGRGIFLRLVQASDVVIDNYAHGVVEGLGLGYDVLARANPGIVYL